MRKHLLIISFLLLVGGYGFGQGKPDTSLIGIWAQCPNGYSSKILELKENGKFKHSFSSCVGYSLSKGKFKIVGDSIILYFNKTNLKKVYIINKDKSFSSSKERLLVKTTGTTFKTAFKDCGSIFNY